MEVPDWLLILLGLLLLLYIYGTWNHGYFAKLKIPFSAPLPLLGNMGPALRQKQNIGDYARDFYNQFGNSKMAGFFTFNSPTIVLRDPELIKLVTVKDFEYFTDHLIPAVEDDLFGKNLFALQGDRWKNMRHTLTPAFTSSKMKAMFLLVAKCGEQIGEYLEKKCRDADGVFTLEMKEFYTKYTNDVIATTAFGIHVDSLEQPDNEFYKMGKFATDIGTIRFLLMRMMPTLMGKLGVSLFPAKVSDFFRSLIHGAIATRERESIVRPDMIHLLMQARKQDNTQTPEDNAGNKTKKIELSDDDITAQALIFFFAGFDTSSTLLCFMSHLLATHPEVQERVREEVDRVLEEEGGNVTYEGIQRLKYLDMVISETLRLWPPAMTTDRKCVRAYTIPATATSPAVPLQPGAAIAIPIFSLHRDARFFPDPDSFDPERFNDRNRGKINPFAYLPFGVGPRSCIGLRFALMEAKIAMAVLTSRFHLRVVDKTPAPISLVKNKFVMMAEGGFWLGLELRA